MPDTRKDKLMAALDALDDESKAHEKAEKKDEDEGKKKPKRKAKKSKLYEMMQ
jgi:hypothetical protein